MNIAKKIATGLALGAMTLAGVAVTTPAHAAPTDASNGQQITVLP